MEDLLHLQMAELLLFSAGQSTKNPEVISIIAQCLLRKEKQQSSHWLRHMYSSEDLNSTTKRAKYSFLKSLQNVSDVSVQPMIAVFCERKAGVQVLTPE